MLNKTLTSLLLPLLLFFGNGSENYATQLNQKTSDAPTGTLQKMIVESGSATMDLDLNGLNGNDSLVARPVTLHFAVAVNSFFPILVFNDLLRGPEAGSIGLVLQNAPALPAALSASSKRLVVEKLPSGQAIGFNCQIPITRSFRKISIG
jgi:hypothetical protein